MSMAGILEGTKNKHGRTDFYGYRIVGEWQDWCTHKWETSEICSGDDYTSEEAVMFAAKHEFDEWEKMAAAHTDWRNERVIIYRYTVELLAECELVKEEE